MIDARVMNEKVSDNLNSNSELKNFIGG